VRTSGPPCAPRLALDSLCGLVSVALSRSAASASAFTHFYHRRIALSVVFARPIGRKVLSIGPTSQPQKCSLGSRPECQATATRWLCSIPIQTTSEPVASRTIATTCCRTGFGVGHRGHSRLRFCFTKSFTLCLYLFPFRPVNPSPKPLVFKQIVR
jgi:hypothetical protein